MSVALASPASVSVTYQPFQCQVCHVRFTRNENLKRHAALHSRSPEQASLCCEHCATTFSRADLRRRHMKKMHPTEEESRSTKRRRRNPSAHTRDSYATGLASPQGDLELFDSATENQHSWALQQPHHDMSLQKDHQNWRPTARYEHHQVEHDCQSRRNHDGSLSSAATSTDGDGSQVDAASLSPRPSMNRSTAQVNHPILDATDIAQSLLLCATLPEAGDHVDSQRHPAPAWTPYSYDAQQLGSGIKTRTIDSLNLPTEELRHPLQEDWFPSASQIERGILLYFSYVSPFVPFLHQSTFDVAGTADYLVLSILSLAYQHGEDPDSGDATDSGVGLSVRCYHRARVLLASSEQDEMDLHDRERSLAMTRAYLLLQLCAMMYLCGEDSTNGLQMHSKMILLARSERLMQSLPTTSTAALATQDLESLWREFIKIESYKRTLFAMHQIDALWYQLLSIPRSLSHLEFKHELPCPDDCWTATSAAQWAHRRLLKSTHTHPDPPVQYGDAVRLFLSADPGMDRLPAFDPYGAVNIAQFLISSAREITGWSTMTGRLCIERFEPIRSSLEALRPLICQHSASHSPLPTCRSTHPALCEATWEMAMIELQMWSPAHTGGIVGGSMDAVLEHSAHLTPSSEFLVATNTAKAIQPHVDWFLCYLDATIAPDSEPPWVAVYAYKVFLIAWQLVRGGSVGAMQVVGVGDGDIEGAMVWARKVFGRRRRRQLGKLILSCLDMLDT